MYNQKKNFHLFFYLEQIVLYIDTQIKTKKERYTLFMKVYTVHSDNRIKNLWNY